MNCVPFALAKLTRLPLAEIEASLQPYVEDGWVRFDGDGQIGVKPDGAVAVLIDSGFKVARFTGDGDRPDGEEHTVAEWGKASARAPQPFLIWLVGHAMVAGNGLIFDADHPEGVLPTLHPNAADPVPLAYRVRRPKE
jgi:hypothetical protein